MTWEPPEHFHPDLPRDFHDGKCLGIVSMQVVDGHWKVLSIYSIQFVDKNITKFVKPVTALVTNKATSILAPLPIP